MKSTSKLTIKLFLIISLFVSAAFAEDDGHMPGGNFTTGGTDTEVCDVTADDGHMPGGNIVCEDPGDDGHMPGGNRNASTNNQQSEDSILNFVRNYLYSLFG